jgi:replicative DNA helicase
MTREQPDGEGIVYRKPPQNFEAEQALLGAILISNAALERVSDFLEADHFFDQVHRQIYDTAAKLIASGKQANPITLRTFFETAEPIDAGLTVPQYLGRLAANASTIINVRDYARTIRDMATRRQLILIGEDVVNAAYDSPVDFPPAEQIQEAETRLYALAEYGRDGGDVTPSNYEATMQKILDAYKNKGKPIGLSTGLKDLDAKLGGLEASDLTIIAGRPGMGKTALGVNIVSAQTVPVHVFSMEMSTEQIEFRLLAEASEIPGDRLRRGDFDETQWRQLVKAQRTLQQKTILVDDVGGLTIAQLAAKARRTKRMHGTGLIVIDYIQLMAGGKRDENRVQEVTEITQGLKALAKELRLPIVALSQLSRAVESRENKRPYLADLRESGSIEQDADKVIFLFREEYYLAQKGTATLDELANAAGKAEANVAKYRNGSPGIVHLQFDGTLTRFSDLALSGHGGRA